MLQLPAPDEGVVRVAGGAAEVACAAYFGAWEDILFEHLLLFEPPGTFDRDGVFDGSLL